MRQVVLVAGAGVGAAWLLPFRPPGLGAVLATALVGAAIVVARRGTDHGDHAWRWVFGALAASLAVLPLITDAAWVLALTVPASAGLVVLAAGGGRSWFAILAPALRAVVLTWDGIGAAGRAVRAAAPDRPRAARHLATGGLTVGLVLLFGTLFASADAVFAGLVDAVVPDVSLDGVVTRTVVGSVVAALTLGVVLLRPTPTDDDVHAPTVVLGGSQWVVPLGTLVALFAAFVLVQLGTLFGGDRVVQLTDGLTYAEHAREGFGQLLVAAVLTLAVIAAAGRYAPTEDAREERLQRGLFAALCGLTLVVLASALHRLSLYEAAFGFTRDRVTAFATILWLGALFVLVLVLGALRRTSVLPRAAVVLTAVALLCFALVRPDVLVAESNIERFAATGELDHEVLWTLSADAAPTIVARLPHDEAACVLSTGHPDDDPLAWNLSRARAETARASLTDDCRLDVTPEERARWTGESD